MIEKNELNDMELVRKGSIALAVATLYSCAFYVFFHAYLPGTVTRSRRNCHCRWWHGNRKWQRCDHQVSSCKSKAVRHQYALGEIQRFSGLLVGPLSGSAKTRKTVLKPTFA
jgi:hypothetical protein